MPEEVRRDPEDQKAYSFAELSTYYAGKGYSKKTIKAYWTDECKVAPAAKAKAKAKEKVKAKVQVYKEKKPEQEELVAAGLCVCGEALIDFVPTTGADGHTAFRPVFGGSPFNCCIAAQRLGVPTTYLGGLSTDMFGEQLHGHLAKEGVDVSLSSRNACPTTLAFVSRDANGEQYAFFKENAADRSLTKNSVAKAMKGRKFRAVHMSLGAVTLEHEKMAEAFQTLFSVAGRQGSLRSFDPNIRANMISESASKYSKRIEKLLKSVDLVKTSEEDAEFLYGDKIDLADVAAKWLKLGPKMVVFTMGSKGAVAFLPGPDTKLLRHEVKLPEKCAGGKTIDKDGNFVAVSDSIGAGDTFMGGLITGCLGSPTSTLLPQLVEKQPWAARDAELALDVLKLAATAAAVNCSRTGCDPPTLADAEKNVAGFGGPLQHLKLREAAA